MMDAFIAMLEARDPALGRFRAYRLEASTDLLGDWPVDITYGLIGSRGRRIRYAASASAFPIASASSSTLSGGSPLRWKFSDDEA